MEPKLAQNTDGGLPKLTGPQIEVLVALEKYGSITGQQLREITGLPRRTLYVAKRRLLELGLATERVSLKDSRQKIITRTTKAG